TNAVRKKSKKTGAAAFRRRPFFRHKSQPQPTFPENNHKIWKFSPDFRCFFVQIVLQYFCNVARNLFRLIQGLLSPYFLLCKDRLGTHRGGHAFMVLALPAARAGGGFTDQASAPDPPLPRPPSLRGDPPSPLPLWEDRRSRG